MTKLITTGPIKGEIIVPRRFDARNITVVPEGVRFGMDLYLYLDALSHGRVLFSLGNSFDRKKLFVVAPYGYKTYVSEASAGDGAINMSAEFPDFGGVEVIATNVFIDESRRLTGSVELHPRLYPSFTATMNLVVDSYDEPPELTPWPGGQ